MIFGSMNREVCQRKSTKMRGTNRQKDKKSTTAPLQKEKTGKKVDLRGASFFCPFISKDNNEYDRGN